MSTGNERHMKTKRALKILGACILSVGVVFTVVGIADFFRSMGTMEPPELFWCCSVGFPLCGIGGGMLLFAFQGEIKRYVKNESVPVMNEAGEELKPAVTSIASAVKSASADGIVCPACGKHNDSESKFCRECGTSLCKTCPSCGKTVNADSKFCDRCGTAL